MKLTEILPARRQAVLACLPDYMSITFPCPRNTSFKPEACIPALLLRGSSLSLRFSQMIPVFLDIRMFEKVFHRFNPFYRFF
jgi:hypothetical protein